MQAMQAIQTQVAGPPRAVQEQRAEEARRNHGALQEAWVNPMGGCLPMNSADPHLHRPLMLSNSVELWQAHFLWIRDLTQPDSLSK